MDIKDLIEKTVSSEFLYDGKVVHLYKDVVSLPNGSESIREYIKHVGAVCVVPVTDEGEIVCVRQYRYSIAQLLLEIPAGKLEENEDPYFAALREFEEETGNKAKELISLGHIYPTCGYSAEKIYLYLALDVTPCERHLDEDEVIEIEYIPLNKVKEMIANEEIKDAKTIIAITQYLLRYSK